MKKISRTSTIRARLDIYLPIFPDTLFCMMERQRCLSPHSQMESKKFPIVICISGGAWIVGCYLWGALVARLLAACGYAVFCPDYRNFPQSDMEGMVLDVSDAIGWVVRNASRYNGDLSNVTLTGQSAGAHLSLMSLISQAQLSAYASSGATPPTAAAYNVCRYNPRVSIQRYIGLSGIYDLQGLVPHFHSRGLYSSVLHKITGGKEKLARFSPAAYFDPQLCNETGETLPENIFDFLPAYMYFLHGDADCSAPVSESANIAFAMRDAQRRMARNRRKAGLSSSSTDAPEQTVFRGGKHGHGYGDVEDGNGSVCQLLDGEGRQCLSVASGQGEVPPAEIRWVKIPNASHTDPIVEEILVARRSSLVEFILRQEDYLAPRRFCGSRMQKEIDENDEDEGAFAALRVPLADFGGSASGVTPVMLPDAILPTCVPHESRPLLMRVASYVIPF
ncbi:unnamed protein product [Trypanosoma congolense IL3000]|uniref:WGS project CAEQ00000000 data, annotated contig 1450 n=1 Tax=Trypanosoma congolense (strain IL3000) TaxID=1068625 RepID=F9W6E2_TRYCI|nr:unnamed protein product [Trypanosoma congolense IL3000]